MKGRIMLKRCLPVEETAPSPWLARNPTADRRGAQHIGLPLYGADENNQIEDQNDGSCSKTSLWNAAQALQRGGAAIAVAGQRCQRIPAGTHDLQAQPSSSLPPFLPLPCT